MPNLFPVNFKRLPTNETINISKHSSVVLYKIKRVVNLLGELRFCERARRD